jgi:hypothetical protein
VGLGHGKAIARCQLGLFNNTTVLDTAPAFVGATPSPHLSTEHHVSFVSLVVFQFVEGTPSSIGIVSEEKEKKSSE